MRFKPAILLPVIAASCLFAWVGLATFLPIAQANPLQLAPAQRNSLQANSLQTNSLQTEPTADRPLAAVFDRLDLTPTQTQQLSAIRRDAQAQLQTIVRPEQRQQFKQTWQQGSFRDAVAAMDLTDDQRQQLRALFQDSRQQAVAVLTDAQRQELRQLLQERLDAIL